MARVKSTEVLKWRKLGGGSFHATIGGRRRIIKPNQVFEARLDEIPEAFRDMIQPLSPAAAKAAEVTAVKEEAAPPVPVEYTLKHRGGGWYDVLDDNGKQVNEKAVKKEEAEKLISSLKE